MSVVLTITIIDDMWKTQVTEAYSINIMPYKNCINFHSKKEKKNIVILINKDIKNRKEYIQKIGTINKKNYVVLIFIQNKNNKHCHVNSIFPPHKKLKLLS